MGNELLGDASISKLDPAGGSSYLQIVNQLETTMTIDTDPVEKTNKGSSQRKRYLAANFGWAGSMTGHQTTEPALDLNGTDEYASVADHSDFDLTTVFEIETIFTPDGVSGTQNLVHKMAASDGYRLYLEDDELRLEIKNTGTTDSVSQTDAANFVAGTQYIVKATYVGGTTTVKFYVDYSLEASSLISGTIPAQAGVNATRLTIGANASNSVLFDGKLYKVAIAAEDTTAEAVTVHDATALKGLWRFHGDLTDDSGNSHTLTGSNITAADYGDLTYITMRDAWEDHSTFTMQFSESGVAMTYTGTIAITSISTPRPQNDVAGYSVDYLGIDTLTITA